MKNVRVVRDRSDTPQTFNLDDENSVRDETVTTDRRNQKNPTLILGPLTYEAHERDKNRETQNIVVFETSKNPAAAGNSHEGAARSPQHPVVLAVVTIAIVTYVCVVALPFVASFIRNLRGTLCSFCINASNIESALLKKTLLSYTEEEGIAISSAIVKYAKMSFWPFVLFAPSLFLFSHLIIEMTSGNDQNKPWWKKMNWKVFSTATVILILLFTFLEAMMAMADTGEWALLGVTSASPLLLMILARLSTVSATKNGIGTTPCGHYTAVAAATTMDTDESMVCKFIL